MRCIFQQNTCGTMLNISEYLTVYKIEDNLKNTMDYKKSNQIWQQK